MEPDNISEILFSLENPAIYAIAFTVIITVVIILIKKEFIGPLSLAKTNLEFENTKLLALYAEIDPDPILRLDRKNEIIDMNNSAKELFKDQDITKPNIKTLIPNTVINTDESHFQSQINIGNKHYTFIVKPIEELGFKHIYFHDITKRVEYEQRVTDYQSQLKKLRVKIDTTNEDEKQRIGKELHDGVGHSLSLLKIEMQNYFIKNEISFTDNEVISMMNSVDDVSDEVRELAHQLKPRILGEFGLVQALRSLVDKTNMKCKMKGYVTENEEFKIIRERTEQNIYRICQEALNNIIKHSDCTEFHVDIVHSDKKLSITISDNGRGFIFDEQMSFCNSSLGLLNMKERAESIGGTLMVDSMEKMGTSIYLSINIKGEE